MTATLPHHRSSQRSLTVENDASAVAVLHFSGSYAQSDFTAASDKLGGTLILHT